MHEDLDMVRKMVEAGATGFLPNRANMNDFMSVTGFKAKAAV